MTAARSLRLTAEDTVALVATSIAEFETRAKQVVTADVGVAYLPLIHEVAPYFGANFYLAALNKRVPVGLVGGNELSRWSFTLGVTANSIAKSNVRTDLFSSYSVVLGAGRRMSDFIRMAGGVVTYRKFNSNPFVDSTHLALTPFVSLSLDFDAIGALGRVGQVLFH